ncbi:MAG: hypothetical protein MUD02_05115 [Bacteroidales bacterium]|jgi:cell division protein FtsQ|nr:hypothetical protein [Bacteroidales bacterium]
MRVLLKILFFIPLLYIPAMPAWLAIKAGSRPCSGVEIHIKDSSDYHFVTKRSLLNLVYNKGGRLAGKPLKEIELTELESAVKELRELRQAEVYTAIDGRIHVFADQRNPLFRIMPDAGGDFFIDGEGVIMRKRNPYNPRLHVVVGNVTVSQAMLNGVSIFDTLIKRTVLRDVFTLVKYIEDDSFWSAQIDQIHVDGNSEINLIPRVGNHLVHLGTIENVEGKLNNLSAFYEKVLPEVGWNKYKVINLEYKDQIVCKKR